MAVCARIVGHVARGSRCWWRDSELRFAKHQALVVSLGHGAMDEYQTPPCNQQHAVSG